MANIIMADAPKADGGRPSAAENDVVFIDADGHILYSYTAADFLQLTAMPSPPTPPFSCLVNDGWNWTLEDAKAYVTKYREHVIGAQYTPADGKQHAIIDAQAGKVSSIYVWCNQFAVASNAVTVDFGDGSEPVEASIGKQAGKWFEHTYEASGEYDISVALSTTYAQISSASTTGRLKALVRTGNQGAAKFPSGWYTVIIASGADDSTGNMFDYYAGRGVVFPRGHTVTGRNGNWWARANTDTLQFVSFPKSFQGATSGYNFSTPCRSLRKLCAPEASYQIYTSTLKGCTSLRRFNVVSTVTSIAAEALSGCSGLRELHFYPQTPPAIANANAFTSLSTSCKIFVPEGTLEAYTTATNYPSSETYTYEEE